MSRTYHGIEQLRQVLGEGREARLTKIIEATETLVAEFRKISEEAIDLGLKIPEACAKATEGQERYIAALREELRKLGTE